MTSSARIWPRDADSTVTIVGVGLIGGSIAAALKKRGFAGRIIGVGRNASRLEKTREAGLIDAPTTDLASAASEAGTIVFCTPVDRIVEDVRDAAPHCRAQTLLTDGGSVKGAICRALDGQLPESATFIGSHPLAGSEKQGFEHADADLFAGRTCVVTPNERTPVGGQLELLISFWRQLGFASVVKMSAQTHDEILALTSHLPHAVASCLAVLVSEPDQQQLASTGFLDTTRIAAGDPELWSAILLNNSEAVLRVMDRFVEELSEIRAAIENGDAGGLKKLLAQAKTNRDGLKRS